MIAFRHPELGIVQQLSHDLGLLAHTCWARWADHIQKDVLSVADRGKEVSSLAVAYVRIKVRAHRDRHVGWQAVDPLDERLCPAGVLPDRLQRIAPG